jgi:hypothetical protein
VDIPDDVGAGSAQLIAQQTRAIDDSEVSPTLLALSQQPIASIFSEWFGIPATIPPASESKSNSDVNQFFIATTNIWKYQVICQ